MTIIRYQLGRFGFILLLVILIAGEAFTQSDGRNHAAYQLQGDYLDKDNTLALKVVSAGKSFAIYPYRGGFPGFGWDGTKIQSFKGSVVGSGVVAQSEDGWKVTIQGGRVAEVLTEKGKKVECLKVYRRSPTDSMLAPKGATIYFGSPSDLSRWSDGKLIGEWLVPPGKNITVNHKIRDHHLHVEFRIPFHSGGGQGRGNSGVFVQGSFEIQILDSYGFDVKSNWAGAIYGQHTPIVNASFPPLQWQTYDIHLASPRFSGDQKQESARMTVYYNGILIHKDVVIKKKTGPRAHNESPEGGTLMLQHHGSEVVFRNIWALEGPPKWHAWPGDHTGSEIPDVLSRGTTVSIRPWGIGAKENRPNRKMGGWIFSFQPEAMKSFTLQGKPIDQRITR